MNPEFMRNAENKFSFAAFCLVMRELNSNPKAEIHLPIFFDATCSSIQHLAALIKDCELAQEVNLTSREDIDEPADIYNALRYPINEAIRKMGRENPLYPNLEFVDLSRSDVKHPIMTKTYNVTLYGIINQLKVKFKTNNGYKINSIHKGEMITVESRDIVEIAKVINDSIFNKYKGLNFIYNYFTEFTKILSKLSIPIIWLTPSGLTILQKYLESIESKITITLGGKTKKLVLREKTHKMNTRKQSSAIIPNVIHSLDASHIANIINSHLSKNMNILTIHDCFGSHPNDMVKLEKIVRLKFVSLYSNELFLEKFHNRNIQSILDYGFIIKRDDILNQDYVCYKTRSKLYIPNLPHLGKFNINKVLNSKYFIN